MVRDPELKTTQTGVSVCTFTVAVNRKSKNTEGSQPEADFFRVTAWRQLGEICAKFLKKGRKVCVIGPVSASAYMSTDGKPHAGLELQADDVEFLSPKDSTEEAAPAKAPAAAPMPADDTDEIPF